MTEILKDLLDDLEFFVNSRKTNKDIEHIDELIEIYKNKAINYTHCCTELPDQMVIKSSDGKLMMLNCNDLLKMELKKKVIEGFETWTVIGTGAVIQ